MAPIRIGFALLLYLAAQVLGQGTQFSTAIPEAEAAALAAIVEDDPSDVPLAKKKTLSPKYPLIFGRALPIPPVKQPKKLVTIISFKTFRLNKAKADYHQDHHKSSYRKRYLVL